MKPKVLLAVTCAALAVAGCGSDSKKSSSSASGGGGASQPAPATPSGSGGGASTNLTLAADPGGQLKFDKSSLSAKAGKVTITMDNPSPVQHAIAIEGNGVSQSGSTVGKGGKSTATASVKPGTYTFFCPVDGHKAAGMTGTLTVK
jgi:plastocyanin